MGSHHDHDHPVTETKPVAFRTPLILGLVTILAILLLVSTCDNKKCCCCEGEEGCKTECTDKHGDEHGSEAKEAHHEKAAATTEEHHSEEASTVVDTLLHVADSAKKVETPAHH